ncbi:MAG: asparagine synthetase B, partial [Bacteroidota bacterium]
EWQILAWGVQLADWLRNSLKAELLHIANDQSFFELFKLTPQVGETIKDFLDKKKYVSPDFIWYLYNLYQWKKRWL